MTERRPLWLELLVHLRLHYQLVFLSPLFVWGFVLGGAVPSARALLGFLAFHVFLYGGLTAFNSYYDRDEGPVGGLRMPPPVSEALFPFSLGVQGVGLVVASFVGWAFTALYLVVMALSVAYSHTRFRWKARPVAALFVVAFGQGAIGFAAGWLCGRTPPRELFSSLDGVLGLSGATLVTVGFYPLTQLYQTAEDRARGDRTFAVVYGPRVSFVFAMACLALASVALVPLVALRFGPWDAVLVGAGLVLFLVVIASWARRFRQDVETNFRRLHQLQLGLSAALLGYVGVRWALG